MERILDWLRQFIIIYLLLTILIHLAAADKYKKYLRFFSGIVLLLFLIMPVLRVVGDDSRIDELVGYEAFWEQLDDTRQGERRLKYLQNDHYIQKYQQAIAEDIQRMAIARDIPIKEVAVILDEYYEIRQVSVTANDSCDARQAEDIRSFLIEEYQFSDNQIYIAGNKLGDLRGYRGFVTGGGVSGEGISGVS